MESEIYKMCEFINTNQNSVTCCYGTLHGQVQLALSRFFSCVVPNKRIWKWINSYQLFSLSWRQVSWLVNLLLKPRPKPGGIERVISHLALIWMSFCGGHKGQRARVAHDRHIYIHIVIYCHEYVRKKCLSISLHAVNVFTRHILIFVIYCFISLISSYFDVLFVFC